MKWKLVPVEPTPEMVCKAEEDSPPFYHGDPWYGCGAAIGRPDKRNLQSHARSRPAAASIER